MLERKLRRRARRRRQDDASPVPEAFRLPAPHGQAWTLGGETPAPILTEGPTGSVIYVGRAPVFDRRLDVAGFQLLIDEFDTTPRSTPEATDPSDTDTAPDPDRSRRLLTRALLEVGLDSLIGGKLGFVEVPIGVLAEGAHLALPPHRMMFEVVGDLTHDDLDVLRRVRADGYRVLVGSPDRSVDPDAAARLTAGVRFHERRPDLPDAAARALQANPRAQILIDRLTDDQAVERCRDAGATWMRGDVLRRAEQVDEPTIPLHRMAVLQLLSELERPDVEFDDIDRLISTDLGMSYKVLRMANSSYLALERRVERTRDAIVYLGLDTVRAAAALLALSEVTDHPPEIVQLSLIRARHCEELMRRQRPDLAHAAFTTGLFSTLDSLLGLSMDQILLRLPIADHIAAALRDRIGTLGLTLDVVVAYERGDLARLNQLGAEPSATVLAYRQALAWVNAIVHGLEGPPR